MVDLIREKVFKIPAAIIGGDENDAATAVFCRKVLFWTLLIWSVVWFAAPALCIKGLFFDVVENLEWGRYYQFGYDKHPFVSMWISRFVYDLTGSAGWPLYLLCNISIVLAVVCVWRVALKFLSPLRALAAALLLLTLQYFSSWALEFNNDVIAISVWAAAVLFFHRALTAQRLADWLLTALFCALAMLTKYYAAVLLAAFALVVLFTPEGRRSFARPGLYAAAALFILLVLPNVVWLFEHDFSPFLYAEHGARLDEEPSGFWLPRLIGFLDMCGGVVQRCALLMVVFALFFVKPAKRNGEPPARFERFFIFNMAFTPLLLTFLIPIISGGMVKDSWLASCFNFVPVYLFMALNPAVSRARIKWLLAALTAVCAIYLGSFVHSKLYKNPYSNKGVRCPYEAYPGREIAGRLDGLWRGLFGTPPKYVIGSRYTGAFYAFYGEGKPHAFYMADTSASNWIDPAAVKRDGALIVWEITPKRKSTMDLPEWLDNLGEDRERVERLPDLEFERLSYGFTRGSGSPRPVIIGVALLPPEND
ncbi:MAG: glycosyltransferase family 39 protein [Victivallaceae bacterium]|nr:glycosyltransferase family 39 protein [Victivallaceae bacterium]